MKRTVGIIGTLIIHLALPVYLLWPTKMYPVVPPSTSTTEHVVEVKLLPMTAAEEAITVGDGPGINGAPDPRICAGKHKTYTGIGIIHGMGSLRIDSAPATYPAYRAGLRVGDQIVEIYKEDGNSPYMRVQVLRDGRHFKFRIKMEQICYDGDRDK